MSIYDNNKELLSTLGVEGNYSTDFEVRKAILNALGGDASMCNSIYEVDLQILKIYQEGGGGGSGSKVVLEDGTRLAYSTFTEIPENYDFSQIADFSYMFYHCTNLAEVPQLNTSNGTNFSYMFRECYNITTIPQLNTSNGTNFSNMFYDCNNLAEVPLLDTSNGTNFINMFRACYNITTIPQLNTSKGTDFSYMFRDCTNLAEVSQLDTSNGTMFREMFRSCADITTIPQLNTSNGTDFYYMFRSCSKLENVQFTGSINANIDFNPCPSLSYESVKSILTACSNTTNTNSKTATFNRTLTDQNGELADLIATCNTKKWTISGLTLE